MGRITQRKGSKGSLKWIQEVVNDKPVLLNESIKKAICFEKERETEWLSPLAGDDYSEYRDQDFLDLLGITLSRVKLKDFWPSGGPQWDALGRIKDKAYFLVEAKAHVSEIISSSQAKSPTSRALIEKSINETRSYLKLNSGFDLTSTFYQYVNRLAHLYLLRVLNNIPAYLLFVYFVNDNTHIPTTQKEWEGALELMHALLGAKRHKLSRYIIDVFIDIQKDI
jgi:hypothetical protein